MTKTSIQKPVMIGRYELVTRLAIGGMAELFLARERGIAGLERLVVIKRILPHLADQPSFVEMFTREARFVAGLSHPNVVQIYDLGHENNSYHIAMEYIHGSTLRELQLLAEEQGISFSHSVSTSIIEQACRGLHAAHELRDMEGKPIGLVHRDISPHNLMCTTEGNVKLLDFGVAKATEGVEATYSGSLKGKFAYLSPEQCLHQNLDRRSDIFALGIVLWELCTGQRLFKRRTELEMMQSIIRGDVPAPSSIDPTIPPALERVIFKALAGDPRHRYETAEQMRQALLSACQKSDLPTGDDQIAQFVSQIAGRYLDERRATLQSALERKLTDPERRSLLHMTGSNSNSHSSSKSHQSALPNDFAKTIVDRPGALLNNQAQSSRHDTELPWTQAHASKPGVGTQSIAHTPDAHATPTPAKANYIRAAALAIVVLLVVAAAIVIIQSRPPVTEKTPENTAILLGEPLAIGWAPTVDPEILREEMRPFHTYLEQSTGRPSPFKLANDYADLQRMLSEGEVALAVMPPLLYVRTKQALPDIHLLAIKQFDGGTHSDALLLVRTDAKITGLDDLKDQRFCFIDQNSTTGYFLPREYIRRAGYDPDAFFSEIHWSGDHFQALRDLIANKCDATATYSGAFLSANEFGIRTGQIRQLAITGYIPQDVFVAGAHLEDAMRERIQRAALDFDPARHLNIPRLGDNQRLTGFSPATDSDFDSLRAAVFAEDARVREAEEARTRRLERNVPK